MDMVGSARWTGFAGNAAGTAAAGEATSKAASETDGAAIGLTNSNMVVMVV